MSITMLKAGLIVKHTHWFWWWWSGRVGGSAQWTADPSGTLGFQLLCQQPEQMAFLRGLHKQKHEVLLTLLVSTNFLFGTSPRVGVVGRLETAPTLRRGTDILLADDEICERQWKEAVRRITRKSKSFQNKSWHLYLLLCGLESIVGRRQTVTIWRKSGSSVRFDKGQRSLVFLPCYLQQELYTEETQNESLNLKISSWQCNISISGIDAASIHKDSHHAGVVMWMTGPCDTE